MGAAANDLVLSIFSVKRRAKNFFAEPPAKGDFLLTH